MSEIIRNEQDFLYPEPSFLQKVWSKISAPAYAEGIDESFWQYSAGKKLNHAAALAGGTKFTIIRVSNGLDKDVAFEVAWKSALDDGMQNIMIYANILGNVRGIDQARFAMTSAQAFIDACPGKVVIWGDFEKDGLTVSVPTRQTIALEFLNNIHLANYETGIYSNVAYWGSLYGNLTPPPYAWLWGANWTSASMGIFPSSWNLDNLVVWQYAVWNKYTWSTPIAGNVPTIDNDRWVWKGGTPEKFLEIVPPPPQDVWAAIGALQQGQTVLTTEYNRLDAEVNALTEKVNNLPASSNLPYAIFHVNGTVPARFIGGFNKAIPKKPVFEIYPSDTSEVKDRIMLNGTYKVFPSAFLGDSSVYAYAILDPILPGVSLYIRNQDGIISAT